jgi:O-antigen/teichoic acid export membrane protein
MGGARRYLSAGVEQALWSVLGLGVNLALIRYMTPHGYGGYIFWLNTGFVLASLQNALTVCHLQALAPGGPTDRHRLRTERLMHAVNGLFLVVVAAAVLGATMVMGRYAAFAIPEAAVFLPAFLLQQYVRALNFSRGRPAASAVQTGLVLLIAAPLLTWLVTSRAVVTPGDVMLCLTCAYGLVGAGGFVLAAWNQFRIGMRLDLRRYLRFARHSGWVFLGVSTTEFQVRFYSFVVAAWFGAPALAVLNAAQTLMRPIPLLSAVWAVVARVDMTRQREAGDWAGYVRTIRRGLMVGLPVAVAWTALIVAAWPLISGYLFAGKYAGYAWLAGMWGASYIFSFTQAVLNSSLQALRAFKPVALANTAASIAIALGILVAMKLMGWSGAIVGTMLGQALEVVIMAGLLVVLLRKAAVLRP